MIPRALIQPLFLPSENKQHTTNHLMKNSIASLLAVAALCTVALAPMPVLAQDPKPSPAPSTAPAKEAVKYTCTMHPEVVKDKPGNCPKCGMKLVEKK